MFQVTVMKVDSAHQRRQGISEGKEDEMVLAWVNGFIDAKHTLAPKGIMDGSF